MALHRKCAAQQIRHMMGELPNDQEQNFAKVYTGGRSHAEIGAEPDISLGAVVSRMSPALQNLLIQFER